MNIIGKAATGLALCAAVATGGLANAAASAADGNVYACDGVNFTGAYCAWKGNDTNWSTCSGGGVAHSMRNRASSLWNNGYLAPVNFYRSSSYTGAWACLDRGDYWANLPLGIQYLSWGPGRGGYLETLDNNVSSHKWVAVCGQP